MFCHPIILHGIDLFVATFDVTRFIDSLLRINEAAQQKVQPRLFNSEM